MIVYSIKRISTKARAMPAKPTHTSRISPRPASASKAATDQLPERLYPKQDNQLDGLMKHTAALSMLQAMISKPESWQDNQPFKVESEHDGPTAIVDITPLMKQYGEGRCDAACDHLADAIIECNPDLTVSTRLYELESPQEESRIRLFATFHFPFLESEQEAHLLLTRTHHQITETLRGICHGAQQSSCRAN